MTIDNGLAQWAESGKDTQKRRIRGEGMGTASVFSHTRNGSFSRGASVIPSVQVYMDRDNEQVSGKGERNG